MSEVWDAWVSSGNSPARATAEAKRANLALKVEIMVKAAIQGALRGNEKRPAIAGPFVSCAGGASLE